MIKKDITTWEEFKKALKESISEDTTYNIKNDLDATSDILTKNIECVTGEMYSKIFKGNGYKINGITAYGNVTVFHTNQNYDYNFRFYDISFTNFMIESGLFSNFCRYRVTSDFNTYKDLFVNCFFNGVCKQFVWTPMRGRLAYFTKCSFNVRCEIFSASDVTFDSCYIIITPLQNTLSFDSYATLINCYIEGTIKQNFSSSDFLTPKFNNNNVFNCKVIIANYSDTETYKVNISNKPVLINRDRLLKSDGVTPIKNVASATNVYFLTDEQMRNKNYIQQNTTFPLYG